MIALTIYLTGYALCCMWFLYQLTQLPDDEVGWDWQWIAAVAVLSVAWPLLLAFEIYDALRGGK